MFYFSYLNKASKRDDEKMNQLLKTVINYYLGILDFEQSKVLMCSFHIVLDTLYWVPIDNTFRTHKTFMQYANLISRSTDRIML